MRVVEHLHVADAVQSDPGSDPGSDPPKKLFFCDGMKWLSKAECNWKKIIVYLEGLETHDLQLCGWDMTDQLWQETKAAMYFAHYADMGRTWVEIKAEITWDTPRIELFLRRTDNWSAQYIKDIRVVDFAALTETPAHAQAYLLSRSLRGKGEELTKDVLHWMLNMTGYSYAQEISLLAEHISEMATKFEVEK